MTIETAIIDLTTQTTSLLDACVVLQSSTTQLIVDAVVVSENAAILPLITVATNLIDTQTLFISFINR